MELCRVIETRKQHAQERDKEARQDLVKTELTVTKGRSL